MAIPSSPSTNLFPEHNSYGEIPQDTAATVVEQLSLEEDIKEQLETPPSGFEKITKYAVDFFYALAKSLFKLALGVTSAVSLACTCVLIIPFVIGGIVIGGPISILVHDILKLRQFNNEPFLWDAARADASPETPYSYGFKITLLPALMPVAILGGFCMDMLERMNKA